MIFPIFFPILLELSNGSWIGMIREVQDGIVDTSLAGFIWDIDRANAVDFTPGVALTTVAVMIKAPSEYDLSVRYFLLGNFKDTKFQRLMKDIL